MNTSPYARLLVCVGMLVTLAGCASQNTDQYYLLQSQPFVTAQQVEATVNERRLGVKEVLIPQYLQRKEIVLQRENGAIVVLDHDLWAEDLQQNLTRLLIIELARSIGKDHVFAFPFEASAREVDETLEISIDQLRASVSGNLFIDVRWRFRDGEEGTILNIGSRTLNNQFVAGDLLDLTAKITSSMQILSEQLGEDWLTSRIDSGGCFSDDLSLCKPLPKAPSSI